MGSSTRKRSHRRRALARGSLGDLLLARRLKWHHTPRAAPVFQPWGQHPVALLGSFQEYRPSRCSTRVAALSACSRELFSLHEVLSYADADDASALNPGWTCAAHVFALADCGPLNAQLAGAAAAEERGGCSLHVSNRGGHHSRLRWLDELASQGDAAARRLRRCVAHAVLLAQASEGGDVFPCLSAAKPSHSWVNVCRSGHYHGLHDHQGAAWSGVYYLRVPASCHGASGALALRTATSHAHAQRSWCTFAALTPVEGGLVIFPGWLPHAVLPLVGAPGDVRVSVSFNVGSMDVQDAP